MEIVLNAIALIFLVAVSLRLYNALIKNTTYNRKLLKQLEITLFPAVSFGFFEYLEKDRNFWGKLYNEFDKISQRKNDNKKLKKALRHLMEIIFIYEALWVKAKKANIKARKKFSTEKITENFNDLYREQNDKIFDEITKVKNLKINKLNKKITKWELDCEFGHENKLYHKVFSWIDS